MIFYKYDLDIIQDVLKKFEYTENASAIHEVSKSMRISSSHFIWSEPARCISSRKRDKTIEYNISTKIEIPLELLILHAILVSDKGTTIYKFTEKFKLVIKGDKPCVVSIIFMFDGYSYINLKFPIDTNKLDCAVYTVLREIFQVRYIGFIPVRHSVPSINLWNIINQHFGNYLCSPHEIYIYLKRNFQLSNGSLSIVVNNVKSLPLIILPMGDNLIINDVDTEFTTSFLLLKDNLPLIHQFTLPQFNFTFRPLKTIINKNVVTITIRLVPNKILDDPIYIDKFSGGILQVEQLHAIELRGINFLYDYAYRLFESGIYNKTAQDSFCRYIGLTEDNHNLENVIQKLDEIT